MGRLSFSQKVIAIEPVQIMNIKSGPSTPRRKEISWPMAKSVDSQRGMFG
jgi:hypothetical protein